MIFLDRFRIYYNQTIHPELVRMERKRKRLLRLLVFSGVFLISVLILVFAVNLFVVGLAVAIPLTFYMTYLGYRIRQFIQAFKPRVVNLILDFIDDGMNMGELYYDPKRYISLDRFRASRLFEFVTDNPIYAGEDYIRGSVGEMPFEMSELTVREVSPVRTKLEVVFQGIFIHGTFKEIMRGEVIAWPRADAQYLMRSVRAFTRDGGRNVDGEIMNGAFRKLFVTYATESTHVAGVITPSMQQALVNLHTLTGKQFYISVHNRKLYVGVPETKNLLEPYLLRSNVRFDLIRDFYSDIHLLLLVVELFDRTR